MKTRILIILCLILSALCLIYSAAIAMLRSGSRFYLFWLSAGCGLILLAMALHFGWWHMLPLFFRRIIKSSFLVSLLLFMAIECCILSQYRAAGEEGLDYIIVLGAQIKASGPSGVLKFRLDAAYDYLTVNQDTVCIVSGGQGSNEPCSEAAGMRAYLIRKGIAPERILMESQSRNTVENITFSARLIPEKDAHIGIVTNNFHVFRSIHLAKRAGFGHVCGIAAPTGTYLQPNHLLREFFGVLKDFLYGNLAL